MGKFKELAIQMSELISLVNASQARMELLADFINPAVYYKSLSEAFYPIADGAETLGFVVCYKESPSGQFEQEFFVRLKDALDFYDALPGDTYADYHAE